MTRGEVAFPVLSPCRRVAARLILRAATTCLLLEE